MRRQRGSRATKPEMTDLEAQRRHIADRLGLINREASEHGQVEYLETLAFGPMLEVDRFQLANGLQVLLCEDHSAPVAAVHTWFKVGSRHEKEGKTGLAHLFEHLMFNETEGRPAGAFDRLLEEAGAESNASTWLDWTQYSIVTPKESLMLALKLEAERMAHLVLREPQVDSEKEVVANERRYRVEDDVEGSISEVLWATAYTQHSYRWPTIGWMEDIEGFTTEDCREFYGTFYRPNNACLVLVGDFSTWAALAQISELYGQMAPVPIPVENNYPEPPQMEERRVELHKATPSEKLSLGYHGPALGDADHIVISVLAEILFGGRASRMHRRLVRELGIATDVRIFVGPFRDPGLLEVYVGAEAAHTAEELLEAVDAELARVRDEVIPEGEIQRAQARLELGVLAGLETADGKASTLGFYDTLLRRPSAAFERMQALMHVDAADLRRVARRYFDPKRRTVVVVRVEK